uniref:Astaxanthin vesicles associated protein n=2 Tax=Haematococcus lacustris TaxID=44745 RepID=E5ESP5_HAELA|nr:astaxanthin vesicles associated protein [Haematococcus lacustris]
MLTRIIPTQFFSRPEAVRSVRAAVYKRPANRSSLTAASSQHAYTQIDVSTPLEVELPPAPEQPAEPTAQPTYDDYEMPLADCKAALLDSLYGTERGLTARSEIRAEINELIGQLEAKNPTPNPTEVLEKLDGEWRLMYTSSSALITVLGLKNLPFVTVGDLTQTINVAEQTVENKVVLSGPLSRTALTTRASFEVRSPKRLQLKLERGSIATPELLSDVEIPSSISLLGQAVDLTQLKDALVPLSNSLQGVVSQVNSVINSTAGPAGLSVPLQGENAQTWQLTTYADDDLRITRGDGGSVFVYCRA